jgi:hypothetical protein
LTAFATAIAPQHDTPTVSTDSSDSPDIVVLAERHSDGTCNYLFRPGPQRADTIFDRYTRMQLQVLAYSAAMSMSGSLELVPIVMPTLKHTALTVQMRVRPAGNKPNTDLDELDRLIGMRLRDKDWYASMDVVYY